MTRGNRPAWSTVLGLASTAILLQIWLTALAPIRWNLTYPGGRGGFGLEMTLSIAMSVLAARKGTHLWYLVTAGAVATFLYIAFILPTPMWT